MRSECFPVRRWVTLGEIVRGTVSPEELLRMVYQMIDQCFANGMELEDILVEIENYIASLEE